MSMPLRVLLVQDSEDEARRLLDELRRGGFDTASERVDTAVALTSALSEGEWDLILADDAVEGLNALAALRLVREQGLGVPLVVVSERISEESAVAAMKAGAADYVLKENLARLRPAIEREIRAAQERRERWRADAARQAEHQSTEEALRES